MVNVSFLEALAFALGYRADTEVLMLRAYFDDSRRNWERTPLVKRTTRLLTEEVVAIGGSVGTLEGWCRLLPEWERIIKESGRKWFHGEEWNVVPPGTLDDYWSALIALMNEHLIAHVGCVVPAHAVRALGDEATDRRSRVNDVSLVEEDQRWRELESIAYEHDPITVCVSWCLAELLEQLSTRAERKIATIFADTDKLQGRESWLMKLLNTIGERSHRKFGPKSFDMSPRDLLQLQAADLVAYELTRYHSRDERSVGDPPRWQYQLLRPKLRAHLADPARLWLPGASS